MKPNSKQTIALILIASTVLLGLAAVYIGIKLGEEPTTTPEEVEALEGPDGIVYTRPNECASLVWEENGTVCITVPTDYWTTQSFIGKHWCDTDEWLSGGCNCPTTASCDQQHEMANGTIYQQGLYYPDEAQCMCSNGTTLIKQCSTSDASTDCAVNIFNGSPYAYKICLDRVPGNRSKTYCGLQQIDFNLPYDANADGTLDNCFLSGLLSDVPECQEEITTTPMEFTCGDYECTSDDQCDTGLPTYECDEKDDPKQNQCVLLICPEGQVLDESTDWPCDCISTSTTPSPSPSPSPSPTPTITLSYTPTTTITPTITRTPTPSPSLSPSPSRSPSPTPPTITTSELPPTALVSNEVDVIIIGLIMILTGLYIYRSGAYLSLGQLYWDKGGRNLAGNMIDIKDEMSERTEFIRSFIIRADKGITRVFSFIPNTIIFIFRYFAILLSNIKDKIILAFLKLIKGMNEDPKKTFEDEVISKQKDKAE